MLALQNEKEKIDSLPFFLQNYVHYIHLDQSQCATPVNSYRQNGESPFFSSLAKSRSDILHFVNIN